MGLFGTLLGGSLGFMLGGPLGMILGGALGSSMTQDPSAAQRRMGGPGAGPFRQQSAQEIQMAFAVALTTLAAKVAKADGAVTQDEVQTFDHFLRTSLNMSKSDRQVAARIFNEAKQTTTPTHQFTQQIHQLFGGHPDRLRDIVTLLLAIALADGQLHTAEEKVIQQICHEFGLNERDYQSCKATFQASRGTSAVDPYAVLGIPSTATDSEVKSAYRKLAKDYHPDVLQSKGLPDDFMEYAKEKMAAINDAWAAIKRERGL